MPLSHRPTLTQYLIEQRRRFPGASGELNTLILDVALAAKAIARAVKLGELASTAPATPISTRATMTNLRTGSFFPEGASEDIGEACPPPRR